jgi:hypothetical protein
VCTTVGNSSTLLKEKGADEMDPRKVHTGEGLLAGIHWPLLRYDE